MLRSIGIAAVCVGWLVDVAHGDEHDNDDGPALVDKTRWAPHIGFAFGNIGINEYSALIYNLDFGVGRWSRANAIYGDLFFGGQRGKLEGNRIQGSTFGAAVHARQDLGAVTFADRSAAGKFECYLDVGVGYRVVELPEGSLGRPEASLAVGWGVSMRNKGRQLGVMMELRLIAAPGVRWERSTGRCIGACDPIEPPSLHRYDFGSMLAVTLPFSG